MTSLLVIGRRSGRIEASAAAAWALFAWSLLDHCGTRGPPERMVRFQVVRPGVGSGLSTTIEQAWPSVVDFRDRFRTSAMRRSGRRSLKPSSLVSIGASRQLSDNDIAEAALRGGGGPDEAVTGDKGGGSRRGRAEPLGTMQALLYVVYASLFHKAGLFALARASAAPRPRSSLTPMTGPAHQAVAVTVK